MSKPRPPQYIIVSGRRLVLLADNPREEEAHEKSRGSQEDNEGDQNKAN